MQLIFLSRISLIYMNQDIEGTKERGDITIFSSYPHGRLVHLHLSSSSQNDLDPVPVLGPVAGLAAPSCLLVRLLLSSHHHCLFCAHRRCHHPV